MYKPSQQGLNLLELLRTSDNTRRVLPRVVGENYLVSEGKFEDDRWFHKTSVGPFWPSNLVEALVRAGLIDQNGVITPAGRVAHLPPSSQSFNKDPAVKPAETPPHLGLLPSVIAAYAWYFESCRKANEDPKSFTKWRKFVTDEQIRDMVCLYRLPID